VVEATGTDTVWSVRRSFAGVGRGLEAPGVGKLFTRAGPLVLIWACVAALAGCASETHSKATEAQRTRSAIESYLRQVEPLRLAVNQLLNTADPILHADHDGHATPAQAARRMDRLERRFAAYTVDIAGIQPALPQLRKLQPAYAHTYVLEDAYLSALVAGLADRNLDDLPNTQAAQRAAIIGWRTGLTLLARESGVELPADLQQAGRGEIAPAPGRS
jgi:hypothetical protein